MRLVFQILSAVSLVLTVLPSVLYMMKLMDLEQMKLVMFIATIVWFGATPLWMDRPAEADATTAA